MTKLETDYRHTKKEQLRHDMPRHLGGMFLAIGVGALALIGGLWATNPGADAMIAGVDAEPNIGIDSSRGVD